MSPRFENLSHFILRRLKGVYPFGFVSDFNKVSTRIVASSRNAYRIIDDLIERDFIRNQIDFDHGLASRFVNVVVKYPESEKYVI